MSLEDLEKELYGQKSKREKKPSEAPKKTPSSGDFSDAFIKSPWGVSETEPSGGSLKAAQDPVWKFIRWGKVVAWFLTVAMVVMLGAAGFYLYRYFSVKDVGLRLEGPSETVVGSPFLVSVIFENYSEKVLVAPKVSLSLPEGTIYIADGSKRIVEKSFDQITPNQIIKEDFEVAVVGKSLQVYQFDGAISYTYQSSALSNRFDKRTSLPVLARDPIIGLDFSAPDRILNGQDFELSLRYQNQGSAPLNGLIEFKLPAEFTLKGSDPIIEQSRLNLENLSAGQEGVIILSGSIIGQEYSYFSFEATAQTKIGDKLYPVNSKLLSLSILPSPLNLKIELEGKSGEVVYPGQALTFGISFSNEDEVNLSDVILEVDLKGEMFDFSSLESKGYFNDSYKRITWTAANLPILKELKAKTGGSTSFNIGLADFYPISGLSDKNFTVKVLGKISSPTVPYNVVAEKTLGIAQAEYKIGGQLEFYQSAYFQEPYLDIVNLGSLPPRVGIPVQYTIHWNLRTFAADFKDVKISSFLGPGVIWTGKVKTNTQSVPSYNSRTQEVTWEIPSILANKGVVEAGPEAVFQVEFIPSSVNIDNRFTIVSRTNLTGTDTFVQKPASINPQSIESKDLNDSDLPAKFDRVQP